MEEDNVKDEHLLALNKKLEAFEEEVRNQIKILGEKQFSQDGTEEIVVDGILIKVNKDRNERAETGKEELADSKDKVAKDNEKESKVLYNIFFEGTEIEFAKVHEDGQIEYNLEAFEEYERLMKESKKQNVKELKWPKKLPTVEEMKELMEEKEKQNAKTEKTEEENENRDDRNAKEVSIQNKQKDEVARKYNVSSSEVIHVSMNKKITSRDKFRGLATKTKGYKDIYILPGRDEYSWITIGVNKDDKEEIIDSKQMKGKNPNVRIKRVDGKEIKEVRPIAMYKIDSRQSYAIIRGSSGKPEAIYCIQEAGRGKEFWGIGIPQADTRNVRQKTPEEREIVNLRTTSTHDLAEKAGEYEEARSLEERGFPSRGGIGVQVEEINETQEIDKEHRVDDVTEDLLRRYGITNIANAMPGLVDEIRSKAEMILFRMLANDDVTYEEAVEEVERTDREQQEDKDENSEGRSQGEEACQRIYHH